MLLQIYGAPRSEDFCVPPSGDLLVSSAGVWDRKPRPRLTLDALPSCALDTQLSDAEIQYGVGRRLGVELCEQAPCPLCLGVVDKWGAHCESGMSGGDTTVSHTPQDQG